MQETLQSRINGALDQLAEATQILNDTPDLDYTTQIDELLEDIVRQQNEIAEKHEAFNTLNGDTSRTLNLGIHQGVTRDATARCAHSRTRAASARAAHRRRRSCALPLVALTATRPAPP